jgi:hypothetical protein
MKFAIGMLLAVSPLLIVVSANAQNYLHKAGDLAYLVSEAPNRQTLTIRGNQNSPVATELTSIILRARKNFNISPYERKTYFTGKSISGSIVCTNGVCIHTVIFQGSHSAGVNIARGDLIEDYILFSQVGEELYHAAEAAGLPVVQDPLVPSIHNIRGKTFNCSSSPVGYSCQIILRQKAR